MELASINIASADGAAAFRTTKSETLTFTHLPLDKMAAILADHNFKYIFLNENDRIPIRI